MDEYKNLFEKYSKLGINEKRDAFSEEIMKISYILKDYLNNYNQNILEEPYNYSKYNDKNMTESSFLDLEYKDIYYIKTELMLLISLIDKKH